jgi:hypothetical protein
MNKQQLIEKKASYEIKRHELLSVSYEAEIEAELAKERARLEEKYEAQRKTDIERVDHYIDLLDELVMEAAKEEALKLAQEVESQIAIETIEE